MSSALHEPPMGGLSNPHVLVPGPVPKPTLVYRPPASLLVYQNAEGVREAVAVTHYGHLTPLIPRTALSEGSRCVCCLLAGKY